MAKTTTGKGASGFTLVEVVVVIAVISILASMAVPFASKLIDSAREDRVRREMQAIYNAILGDPTAQKTGFVGEMGRLPTSLNQIVVRQPQGLPNQAGPTTGQLNIRYGWNGPYINSMLDPNGAFSDPWGTPYVIVPTGTTGFRIQCYGVDRAANTTDDFYYPPCTLPIPPNPYVYTNPLGSIQINVHVWDDNTSVFVRNPQKPGFAQMVGTVTFYFASAAGAQTSVVFNLAGANPPFTAGILPNGYPAGLHAVGAVGVRLANSHTLKATQSTVYIAPNTQSQLDLYLR